MLIDVSVKQHKHGHFQLASEIEPGTPLSGLNLDPQPEDFAPG